MLRSEDHVTEKKPIEPNIVLPSTNGNQPRVKVFADKRPAPIKHHANSLTIYMTMVSAKDNKLTYLWRRGGVCQECRSLRSSGCHHQQCKKN